VLRANFWGFIRLLSKDSRARVSFRDIRLTVEPESNGDFSYRNSVTGSEQKRIREILVSKVNLFRYLTLATSRFELHFRNRGVPRQYERRTF
jgi:hypothetical protein